MPITRFSIYYFSGTGNARQIAYWFAEYAKEKGVDCQVYNIENAQPCVSTDETIAFISPIHGFNYPKIMLDFIRRFPHGKNRVILMDTRAGLRIGKKITPGLTGIAFFVATLILRLKGYKIAGMIPFDMPSNWLLVHSAFSSANYDYILQKNKGSVSVHADRIFSGGNYFFALRDIVQDVLITPIAVLYYFCGRFFLAKQFFASADCTRCGLCEKNCPAQAIRKVSGKPYWTVRCESCMQCMAQCPHNAIEAAHGLIIALIFAGSTAVSFFSDFLPKVFAYRLLNLIFETVVLFAALMLLYLLQHFLLKNRYLSRIITAFSLTHYRFWWKRNPKK